MKAALVIDRVLSDSDANLAAILNMANDAADDGAELIVFPEAALTGLSAMTIPLVRSFDDGAYDREPWVNRES